MPHHPVGCLKYRFAVTSPFLSGWEVESILKRGCLGMLFSSPSKSLSSATNSKVKYIYIYKYI